MIQFRFGVNKLFGVRCTCAKQIVKSVEDVHAK